MQKLVNLDIKLLYNTCVSVYANYFYDTLVIVVILLSHIGNPSQFASVMTDGTM